MAVRPDKLSSSAGDQFELMEELQGLAPVGAAELFRCLVGTAYRGALRISVEFAEIVRRQLHAPRSRRFSPKHAGDR